MSLQKVKLQILLFFFMFMSFWVIFTSTGVLLSTKNLVNRDQLKILLEGEMHHVFKDYILTLKVENQKKITILPQLHGLHHYEKVNSIIENKKNFVPSIFYKNFTPQYILGRGPRHNVSVVIGIPSVKRPTNVSYLYDTLCSIFGNLYPIAERNVSVVVLLAETDRYFVETEGRKIYSLFTREVDNGLLQIIAPRVDIYPDFSNLPKTLGDPPTRVAWRAKEVYDAAYLMYFCQKFTTYYMMLEDDVIAAKGFLTATQAFASRYKDEQYIYLSLAKFNSIGKLFRSTDINKWVTYFFTFFGDKPIDWLMFDFVTLLGCNPEMSVDNCKLKKKQLRPELTPGLFQHIGKQSSLNGKTQTMVDQRFSINAAAANPHKNPKAKVQTSFIAADLSHAKSLYFDSGGMNTHLYVNTCVINDYITIVFETMQNISKISIKSGNQRKPEIFDEGSALVEVTADEDEQSAAYEACALFDSNGWAECYYKIPKRLSGIRLRILKNIFHKVWLEYIFVA